MALALAHEAINMGNPPSQAQQMFFEASTSSWIQQRFLVSNTRVFDAIYHPDGEHIITASWDGRVVVWDIESNREIQSLQPGGRLFYLAIHPDGNLVAISGVEGTLQLWDLQSDEVTQLVEGEMTHQAPRFSRDGSQMVSTSHNGMVNIWDVQTHSKIRSFKAHDSLIFSIQFNFDESLLITSALDGSAKIWDFETDELIQTLNALGSVSLERPADIVWDAQFLPDGERVLSVDSSGVVALWNWSQGEIIWLKEDLVQIHDLALSPDGDTFMVGLGDPYPQAKLFDIETGNLIRIYAGHSQRVQNVDFSPDGTQFVTASDDGTAIVWPMNWEGAIRTVSVPAAHAIAWHPTHPLVAVVGASDQNDGIIRLVNVDTGNIEREIDEYEGSVDAMAFTPDGQHLIVSMFETRDQWVFVWDMENDEQRFKIGAQPGNIRDIAVHPNGRIVAIGQGEASQVFLWDFLSGERMRYLEAHQDWVTAVVFSPDGRYLYSGGRDGALYKWDVENGEIVMRFDRSPTPINDLDVTTDRTRIVSASNDHTAVIWNTSNGQILVSLYGHTDQVIDAKFSSDDRTIMTSSLDGRLILWDATTGENLRTYVVADTVLSTAADLHADFSPDSQYIVSGANDILTVWDASPIDTTLEAWIRANRHIPDFTCEQRELYVIEPLCETDS